MIANYLRIALRNIRQNPVYALINIFSLAIGLSACMVIYLFIADERSFDAWHSKKERIFRLNEVQNFTGTKRQLVALTGGPFGPVMKEEFHEIANYTRYWGGPKRVVKLGEKQILVDQIITVDSSFLTMFDFALLHGDRATALDEPNTMLLTEETARKFFDRPEEAVGQTVTKRDREFKITGILKNVPENSHLQFDALESFTTYSSRDSTMNTDWNGNYLVTYLQLQPQTDWKAFESKLPEWFARWTGEPDINEQTSLYLQPFTEVHLGSSDVEHDYNNYRKFNGKYLGIFMISGIFILLIASVNFMNLTTARASHRWKEIGVRTSVGARKLQLFGQFILESLLLATASLVLAVLIVYIFLPVLNVLVSRQLTLLPVISQPANLLILVGLTLGLGGLTGIYPSLYMTSVNAARVLKGAASGSGKSIFQRSLVVVQFALAIGMMVGTGVVMQQLQYMRTTDVGFATEHMVLIELDRESNKKYNVLKTEMAKVPHVLGVTASGQRLGNNFHQWGYKVKSDTGIINMAPSNVNVDPDYLTVYGMTLKEGRNFTESNPADINGKSFIVNESMVRDLGLKNPVGTQVGLGWFPDDSLGSIIGVVKDFNFNSLHHAVNTLSIVCFRDWGFEEITVKIDGAAVQQTLEALRGVWESQVSGFPFTYTFLDEHLDDLYRTEQQMSAVVGIMAALAILISCMGLFGLALITTERRTKEVGIRKALGASALQITLLMSGQFGKLIVIAFVLIAPLTWVMLSNWLSTFAFRIPLNPVLFLLGGLTALAIGMLTIAYHTLRSARANPVNALRYE